MTDVDKKYSEAKTERKKLIEEAFKELNDPNTSEKRKKHLRAVLAGHADLKEEQSMSGNHKLVNGKLTRIKED